ncbi:MAG: DUF2357 domain-containing protein [Myxococcota bacterium]
MAILRCRSDGSPPPASPRGWVVDAESDWVAAGTAEEMAAVRAALGPAVCSPISAEVLLIRFGNSVGVSEAGPLGRLVVRTGKWGDDDYDLLLEDLSRVTASLPFASTAPSALPYERTVLDAPVVLYHAFVWLRHAILRDAHRELHDALEGIVRSPHRRLVRTAREVPVELAGRLGARALSDIACGRWPLTESRVGFEVQGRRILPRRVEEELVQESVDTAENRFVKAFLGECAWVVDAVGRRLGSGDGALARRVRADCTRLAEALGSWRRASIWSEIGSMTHFPVSSTVVQRRSEYQVVLRHHQMLRLGSRVPLDPETTTRLLESKDIATMYELWSAFALLGEVRAILGPATHTTKVVVDNRGASVRWGVVARWADGTELAYNATFTAGMGFHGRSRSLRVRPDVAIFVPTGPAAGLHLFDAKFRLEGTLDPDTDDEVGYKPGDLHKMHAYRDAIPTARSAWVLYPGGEAAAFLDDGRRGLDDLGAGPVEGVGALPLRPGLGRDGVRAVLGALFHANVRFANSGGSA